MSLDFATGEIYFQLQLLAGIWDSLENLFFVINPILFSVVFISQVNGFLIKKE